MLAEHGISEKSYLKKKDELKVELPVITDETPSSEFLEILASVNHLEWNLENLSQTLFTYSYNSRINQNKNLRENLRALFAEHPLASFSTVEELVMALEFHFTTKWTVRTKLESITISFFTDAKEIIPPDEIGANIQIIKDYIFGSHKPNKDKENINDQEKNIRVTNISDLTTNIDKRLVNLIKKFYSDYGQLYLSYKEYFNFLTELEFRHLIYSA